LTVLIAFFWLMDRVLHVAAFHWLDFYSRSQTLLPLGALLGASIVGAIDDWLDVRGLGHKGRGIKFRIKILLYAIVAGIGAYWFYHQLQFTIIRVPFIGSVDFGI